ncbi:FAD-binding oxidoreductase [Pseudonocardia benzenivorans]|jgi:propane monooxygenase reductase subunit|uniref:Ferredoxin--NAD(+) reductase n=2 Tax=Pseudonocardia TaxID=1847 RepID=F4CTT4_PSEUX|nr:FAD-binding oxidoreductase [Pseudonocardia dioxanivorans]AEA22893.1 Ferredoxin--NAD(+) reductase [Pseudonocardia dioxanivorans CB1190]GJF06742.1 CDP-6-deoxy-delta-3,4-glucoseen reductase [Pseudonocardia sp. D17]
MGKKHIVRFEPVGIEIEVDEDQNILRAAAEQGVQLMHGCKEGQCAACKSFVLEGEDIDYDSYSTFALPDYEKEEGSTLLCRAHAYEDLVIELLNYDEEIIRGGLPLRKGVAEVVSNEEVTHDMRHLVLKLVEPEEIKFFPGQYLDLMVPGTEESRSFSMANVPGREGHFEFVIKIYPDGLFSEFLATKVSVGDRLDVEGPFGTFTLRESRSSPLIFVGGGAGLAPVLGLLRSMADRGVEREAVFYYGARGQRDLCFEKELRELEERLPNFRYVPALSEPADGDDWSGETGLITDVVKRLESDLSGRDAYVCGPPPMVDAAIPVLTALGVSEQNIFYDKFTTTGEQGGEDGQ